MKFRFDDTLASHSGWVRLFSPRSLFLMGTIQALSPYLWWRLQGTDPNYSFEVTYIPLLVFVVGYAAFCLGTILAPKAYPRRVRNELSLPQLRFCLSLLLIVLAAEIAAAIRGYGAIPILAYSSGETLVNDVNQAQLQMESGQLGALTASLFFLNGLLLLTIMETIRTRRKSRFLIYTGLFLVLFGGLMAGKRQAVVMTIVFLACGLAIRFGNPLGALLQALNLPRWWAVRSAGLIAVAVGLVAFIGFIPSLRTGKSGSANGLMETMNDLNYTLMNYEAECADIGLAPYRWNFLDPLRTLLPKRSSLAETLPFNDLPIHPEPTAPAGFYSPVQWGLGAAGAWAFAALCGFISQLSFSRARFSTGHLLIYSQIAWALLSIHSYNHFLNLIFVPVPVLGFALFSWIVSRAGAQKFMAPMRRPRPQSIPVPTYLSQT